MTITVENPQSIFKGNGTKTGYSFAFSFTDNKQIEIYYTPEGGSENILGVNDYKLTPAVAPAIGATIEFLTITPAIEDAIRVIRNTPINQNIDFVTSGTVTPTDVEFSLDKLTRIVQEHDNQLKYVEGSPIPDPTLAAVGHFISTNGQQGYMLFPTSFPIPVSTDDGKLLSINFAAKTVKYIDRPPTIPVPTQTYTYLISNNGAYVHSPEHEIPSASDVGKQERWDGSKWELITPTGSLNPPIPHPTAADSDKILSVDSTGDYELIALNQTVEDDLARTWFANGVLSGCKVTFTGAAITIAAGQLIFCLDGTSGVPNNAVVYVFPGVIYTLSGIATRERSYIVIDNTGKITEEATRTNYVRGTKLTLFEVDHSNGTSIESIQNIYYDVNSLPEQIRQIFECYGNTTQGIRVSVLGTNQLSHTGGFFYGFNVGSNDSPLSPHMLALPAKSPMTFEFRTLDGKETVSTDTFPAVPDVELTPNTLTPLGAAKVAYYPCWLRSDNTMVFQYGNAEYSPGAEPSVSEYLYLFEKENDIRKNSALVGLVKWKNGKDFTDYGEFLNSSSVTTSGGASGLLPATPADENKIYTIDSTGKTVLGVAIQQADTTAQPLADAFLRWDRTGTRVIASDVNVPSTGTFGSGSYLLSVRNGVIEALTSATDYVDPSLWASKGQEYYLINPYPVNISRKGIMATRGTYNNVFQFKQLRFGDFIDHFTTLPWDDPQFIATVPPNTFITSVLYQPNGSDKSDDGYDERLVPNNPAMVHYVQPSEGNLVMTNVNLQLWYYVYPDTGRNVSSNNVYCYPLNYGSGINASNTTSNPVKFNIEVARLYGPIFSDSSDVENVKMFIVFKPKVLSLPIEFKLTITTLTFTVEELEPNKALPVKIWTTSSTPITDETTKLIDMQKGVNTYRVDLTTTFKSTDTVLYHSKTGSPGASTSDTVQIGFQTLLDKDFPRPAPQADTNITDFKMEVELEATIGTPSTDPVAQLARYEYGTLPAIDALAENTDATTPQNTHVFNGKATPLAAGKIVIAYYLMYPKVPQSLADYDPKYEGIIMHQFTYNEIPTIRLEEQTGTDAPTNSIEAIRRQSSSCLYEFYDLDCTAEQFNNWKLVVYFRTTATDTEFKALADKVGASLWFVNASDLA